MQLCVILIWDYMGQLWKVQQKKISWQKSFQLKDFLLLEILYSVKKPKFLLYIDPDPDPDPNPDPDPDPDADSYPDPSLIQIQISRSPDPDPDSDLNP